MREVLGKVTNFLGFFSCQLRSKPGAKNQLVGR